ncbi:MAG: mechanosensitive ion channel family protein [Geminicoccaceae bacterium]|nr:mechanosensitive ion channel family protein [Geminicoccaceae bacterium]
MARVRAAMTPGSPLRRRGLALLLLLALLAVVRPAGAQQQPSDLPAVERVIDGIAEEVRQGDLDRDGLQARRERLNVLALDLQARAAAARDEAAPLREQLGALGPPADAVGAPEAPAVTAERRNLERQVAEVDGRVKRAELLAARARSLGTQLAAIQLDLFRARLVERGASPLLPSTWRQAGAELGAAAVAVAAGIGQAVLRLGEPEGLRRGVLVLLVLGSLTGLAVWGHRTLLDAVLKAARRPAEGRPARLREAAAAAFSRLLLFLPIAVAARFLRDPVLTEGIVLSLLQALVRGLAIVCGMYVLAFSLFSPRAPGLRPVRMGEAEARRSARDFLLLGAVFALDQIVQAVGGDLGWTAPTYAALNLFTVLAASWLFNRIAKGADRLVPARPPAAPGPAEGIVGEDDADDAFARRLLHGLNGPRLVRAASLLAAFLIPAAALLGYFALSRFLLTRLIASWALGALVVLVFTGVRALGQSLPDRDEAPWWLTLPTAFALAALFLPLLAVIWGTDPGDLWGLALWLWAGFAVGGIRLAPGAIILAVLVFLAGLLLTRLLQAFLQVRVLRQTRLDQGARASITAGLGYLGVFLTLLAAIAAAGVDLSSLALVAGALSVGIGFGLQTVVNNFVSGLILLVERPFKAGDWIVVGGQNGYVRKVKVRATEIVTFDRATLTVPNAELVAQTVTNWTHRSTVGRFIVPIRASYGSDTAEVRKILLDVAHGHEMVLRRPEPHVLLMDFGENGLHFELRGFLRDINWLVFVQSDLRFAIDRRFRVAGIAMPLPQRQVYVHAEPEGKDDEGNDA